MKISVVIPFYNRAALLRRSIPSILAQTLPAHEIIVADDCSAEEIGWLAQEFPTVRVVRLPQNMGPGGARYHGALAATGTHIASLDSDDHWYPEKLDRQVAFATKTGDPRGIYSHQQWVNQAGTGMVRPTEGPRPGEPGAEYLFVSNGFIQSNTFLIERELYMQLTCVSDEGVYADDWEIVMRSDMFKCHIYLLKEVLSQWNVTNDPLRFSNRFSAAERKKIFEPDYLPREARYFTEKAKAAYRARYIAPPSLEQGRLGTAGQIFLDAIRQKALSPMSVLKLVLSTLFPGAFNSAAALKDRLRRIRNPFPVEP